MRFEKDPMGKEVMLDCGAQDDQIDYEPHCKIVDFVDGWERRNLGRPEQKLNDDDVLSIAETCEAGQSLPAVILWKRPDGYEPLDGRQRIGGVAFWGGTEVGAYVLRRASKEVAERIAKTANFRLNGRKPGAQFQKGVAFEFIDGGMSVIEAARAVKMAKATLETAVQARRTGRILEANGFDVPMERRNGLLAKLDQLSDTEQVLCKTFDLCERGDFRGAEALKLVSEVVEAQTTEARCAALEAIGSRPEICSRVNGTAKHARSPIGAILSSLRGLVTQLTNKGCSLEIRTRGELEDFRRLTESIRCKAQEILDRSPVKEACA